MKVLVAGGGLMTLRLVESLMQKHQVVCLTSVGSLVDSEHLNAEIHEGAITSPASLTEAGAGDVDVFVACSASDEQNIVACMAAHRLGAKRTLCVINGHSFLSTTQDRLDMAATLGIDEVIRPIEQLSDELIAIVQVPGALEIEPVADGRLALFRYAVGKGSPSLGKALADLRLPQGVRLVHVRRGDEFLVPRGDTELCVGDKVIAMGEHKSCAKLGALLCNQRRAPKDAAVIGGGRVGRSVTRGLMRAGWRVTVVDKSEERCRKVAESTEALVLHGDGTDVAFLEQEGIPDRQVVIAVTDSDEKNLLVSLVVKQLGGTRVVTRADRLTNEKLFERVGVDVVRSAKGAAIRTVLRFIDDAESEILAELEHGETCVLEVTLRDSAEPIAMSDLAPPAYSVVGAILRGEKTIIPGGADSLEPLDHLFVFCSRHDQEAVHDYFEHPRPAPKD